MVPRGGPRTTPGILSWLKGALALAVSGAGKNSATQSAKGPASPLLQGSRQSAGSTPALLVLSGLLDEVVEVEDELESCEELFVSEELGLFEELGLLDSVEVSVLVWLGVGSEFWAPVPSSCEVELELLVELFGASLDRVELGPVRGAEDRFDEFSWAGWGISMVGSCIALEPECSPQAVKPRQKMASGSHAVRSATLVLCPVWLHERVGLCSVLVLSCLGRIFS